MQISVIRSLPPTLVGVCGTVHDRRFEAFEAELDAQELAGATVERGVPDDDRHPGPVVSVNGAVLCRGRYPTREEWVRAIGAARRADLAHAS